MSVQARLYTSQALSERYSIMSPSQCGVSRQTLYRWRKEKGFPEPRVTSPNLLWLKTDVHKWEEANGLGFLQEEEPHNH